MNFDRYTIISRVFPALLCVIPIYILHSYVLRPILGNLWNDILTITIISDISILSAFTYTLIQSNRFISKYFIEKKMFNCGLSYPTTNFLMFSNSDLSPVFIKKIHQKIFSDFGIKIPNHSGEIKNPTRSRQIIRDSITRIRTRVGKGILVHQHLIEYGFVRNIAGGAYVASAFSIINLILLNVFVNDLAFIFSIFTTLIYGGYALFSKPIIEMYGNNYAKKLIDEYMNL